MSQTVVLSTLSALVDDATLAALQTISSSENNGHRSTRESAYNSMLSALKDAESSWAGAAAPEVVTGKPWYDTVNGLLKVRRAASWDTILDAATAYGVDLKTAGTATFRVGGVLNVNTTQQSRSTTGVLMTYTLPGGTLARDGQFVHVVCFGTGSGTAGTVSLQPRFGTTAITTHSMASTGVTDWAMEFWICRTGAATQDCGSYMILNTDADGSTTLCDFATAAKTLSGDLAIDINVSALSAARTITQEIMIVEWGNF